MVEIRLFITHPNQKPSNQRNATRQVEPVTWRLGLRRRGVGTLQLRGRAATIGWINQAVIEDDALIIEGWVFCENRAIDTIRVTNAGRAFDCVEVATGLPSPHVV